jgi:hypothetical protein
MKQYGFKIFLSVLIFGSVSLLSGCGMQDSNSVQSEDKPAESLLNKTVNNPYDRAIQLKQIKDKAQDKLKGIEKSYNDAMDKTMEENGGAGTTTSK